MKGGILRYLVSRTETHPVGAATTTTWLTQAANLGFQVALVPVLLHVMGAEKLGVWFYLLGWAAILGLVDFGISNTIARQIAYSGATSSGRPCRRTGAFIRAHGQRAVARVMACQRWFTARMNIMMILLGIILERMVIFRWGVKMGWEAHVCWYLLVAQSVVLNQSRIPSALLSGLLRPALDRIGLGAGLVVQNGLFIVSILIFPSLTMAGLAFVLGALAQKAVLTRFTGYCFAASPVAKANPAMLRQLWRLCWRQGATNGAAFGMFQTNPLLVGNYLGPVAVATMAIPIRIAGIIDDAIRALFLPQVHFMTNFLGQRNSTGVFAIFWRSLLLCVGAVVVSYGIFAWIGTDVVRIWTAGRLPSTSAFIMLLCAVHGLILIENVLGCFVVAHGVSPFAGIAWIGTVVNVGLTILLLPRYGIEGAIAATLAAQLLTTFWFTVWWSGRLIVRHVRSSGREVVTTGFREALRLTTQGTTECRDKRS